MALRAPRWSCTGAARRSSCEPGSPTLTPSSRSAATSTCGSPASRRRSRARWRCRWSTTGMLGLDDSITARVPALPAHWSPVTLRMVLSHTGGLPSFTKDAEYLKYFGEHLHGQIDNLGLIEFVRNEPLDFAPGTAYQLLEHRQHRDRPGRRGGDGQALHEAAGARGPAPARPARDRAPVGLQGPEAADPRIRGAARGRRPDRVLLDGLRRRLRRHLLDPARPGDVHARVRRRRALRRRRAPGPVQVRRRRQLGAAGSGTPGGRAGAVPLQDSLRHGLRPHRQLPRLHPVHRCNPQRQALGDRLGQPPARPRRHGPAARRRCSRPCVATTRSRSAPCSGSPAGRGTGSPPRAPRAATRRAL